MDLIGDDSLEVRVLDAAFEEDREIRW